MSTRYSLLALGLVALLLALVLRAAPPLRLDVGTADATRFLWGFYDAEMGEQGERFRWSGPDARLMLHGAPPGAARLELRLSGERLVAEGAPAIALARDKATFAAFDVAPGWRVYRLLLPPGSLAGQGGAALPLELRSAVSRPGADEAARDYRPLGVPLSWLRLTPLAGADTGALPRAAWLTWLVGIVGLGLALLLVQLGKYRLPMDGRRWTVDGDAPEDGRRWTVDGDAPHRLPSSVFRPGLLAACGAALALWAWRDPYSLAWALPATPWALGAASLLLAGAWLWGRAASVQLRAPLLIGGVIALALALGLMHAQLAVGLGVGLAIVALLALAAPANGLGAGVWADTDDRRPTTDDRRPTTDDRRPTTDDRRPTTDHRLSAIGYRLSAIGYRLSAIGYRLSAVGLLLGAIFLLALGLRLFRIDVLPFGLWRDEARHGLIALRIAEDPAYRPVYVLDERVQLPGLGLYPFALALKLFGVHLWTMRGVTALAGALTVLPLYAVAARLTGRPGVGLLAALLLAVSSWHISISRFSFPTIYEPLLSLTVWWLVLKALAPQTVDGGRWTVSSGTPLPSTAARLSAIGYRLSAIGYGLLTGILLGVVAQTYHIGRITPLTAGWLALLLLARAPGAWRGWLLWAGAAALGLGLTLAPLLGYALARPADFNDRVGAVFLLSVDALKARAPLAALDENLGRYLLMFTVAGDANGRHHAPYRPMLDILSGLGLLLGLAAVLRRLGDWRSRFLLGAVGVGLLPGLLAVDAPHAMRSFGALAPLCIIAALGLAELWRMQQDHRRPTTDDQNGARPRLAVVRGLSSVIVFVGLVGLNAGLYFGVMPGDPRVFGGFYPVQSQMGIYVGAADPAGRIYVPEGVRGHPSFLFLAAGRPVETFSGGPELPVSEFSAPPMPGDRFLLSGYFAEQEAAALAAALGPMPAPSTTGPPFPDGRGPTYYVVIGAR